MPPKILLVDDEAAVLDGYRRTLYRDFEVDIALGAAEGLTSVHEKGPYAVVISDMRMPGMNGAEFLGRLRGICPDTVRMLLTGYTEVSSAIEAVNHGSIFRFLTKPCERDVLLKAITAGVEQYRLVTGERDLLEKTLMGSIKVMADVLSAASPEAFGRSLRIAHYVQHMMRAFKLAQPWRLQAAATLSQLGCVALDPQLMKEAYAGALLREEEQTRFEGHPAAAMHLLASIPRLEAVAWMIGQQFKTSIPERVPGCSAAEEKEIQLGARMLKLAVAYEQLRTKYPNINAIVAFLRGRKDEFEPELLATLNGLVPDGETRQLRKVSTGHLRTGMILNQEIKNANGVLMVAKGQEITSALLMKLDSLSHAGLIDKEVMALVSL